MEFALTIKYNVYHLMHQSLLDSKQTNAGTAATYSYLYSKYTVLEIEAIHKKL